MQEWAVTTADATTSIAEIRKAADECRAAWAETARGTWGWHIHHDQLAEPMNEVSIEDRITWIMRMKPLHEQAIRIRLMRPIAGKIPAALHSAGERCVNAYVAFVQAPTNTELLDRTQQEWVEAHTAYRQVLGAHQPQLAQLHARECVEGCVWETTGERPALVFPTPAPGPLELFLQRFR